MLKACAQTVQNRCASRGKKCAHVSTVILQTTYCVMRTWVEALLLPQLKHLKTTWFSTAIFVNSPLLISTLSPLSTASTIITTNKIY